VIAALALALLAAAPADALPFAPPIDTPLHYRQTAHSLDADGGDLAFTVVDEVSYARDGAGYVMTIRTISADAKAASGATAMFEAAMRPFVGVTIRLRLSASGDPGALIDGDAIWARIVAAVQAAADAEPADEPADRRATLQQTARGLSSLPPAQREAMMKAPAISLLGLGVPALAVGASAALDEPLPTPLGATLRSRGTIRRDPDRDGARRYVRDLATGADDAARQGQADRQASALASPRLHEIGSVSLSVSSGLLLAATTRITMADGSIPGGERPISDAEVLLVP